jgi:flagellar hook assembly protein FlgD
MEVKITIYNIYGVPLKNISSPWPVLTSGIDPFAWDGSDETGKRLPNGIYPYRITFSNQQGVYYQTTQKLMIVK